MNALRFTSIFIALVSTVAVSVAEEPAWARSDSKIVTAQSLSGIDWQPNLDAAKKMAGKTQPGKPIVLLRVLGNLDDKL